MLSEQQQKLLALKSGEIKLTDEQANTQFRRILEIVDLLPVHPKRHKSLRAQLKSERDHLIRNGSMTPYGERLVRRLETYFQRKREQNEAA